MREIGTISDALGLSASAVTAPLQPIVLALSTFVVTFVVTAPLQPMLLALTTFVVTAQLQPKLPALSLLSL